MYLFIYRERGREGEREGEKHQCEKDINLTSRIHPDQRQNLQPRHVPWLGIKPGNPVNAPNQLRYPAMEDTGIFGYDNSMHLIRQ